MDFLDTCWVFPYANLRAARQNTGIYQCKHSSRRSWHLEQERDVTHSGLPNTSPDYCQGLDVHSARSLCQDQLPAWLHGFLHSFLYTTLPFTHAVQVTFLLRLSRPCKWFCICLCLFHRVGNECPEGRRIDWRILNSKTLMLWAHTHGSCIYIYRDTYTHT